MLLLKDHLIIDIKLQNLQSLRAAEHLTFFPLFSFCCNILWKGNVPIISNIFKLLFFESFNVVPFGNNPFHLSFPLDLVQMNTYSYMQILICVHPHSHKHTHTRVRMYICILCWSVNGYILCLIFSVMDSLTYSICVCSVHLFDNRSHHLPCFLIWLMTRTELGGKERNTWVALLRICGIWCYSDDWKVWHVNTI